MKVRVTIHRASGVFLLTLLTLIGGFQSAAANSECAVATVLEKRDGTPVTTSGRVPHVQTNVTSSDSLNRQLHELVFALPGLSEKPTVISLPGASGMWLADDVPVANPMAIIAGRELAHIHPDGSLHAPLPHQRALEVEKQGWGERHPWANKREGWEGFVMLYSATTDKQLDVLYQLITESYDFVTGENLSGTNC